jgi:nucleotide-binding universal stress UspA family protein
MKLLVAIDYSEQSKEVITQVETRLWPKDTEVCVFSAVNAGAFGGLWMEGAEIDGLTEAAEALVMRAAKRFSSRGFKTTTAVQAGFPASAIVEHARIWGADFILVGSHGHGGLTRFLLGSVAKSVAHSAPCSVEIMRPRSIGSGYKTDQAFKIIAATDGSECSAAAMWSLARRPWPDGTHAKVVAVAESFEPPNEPNYISRGLLERYLEESHNAARNAVIQAKEILSGTGLDVQGEIREGEPKSEILDLAKSWNADLVVVGSHGRRGINRLLLGSVSEAVAVHAPCSVDIIR